MSTARSQLVRQVFDRVVATNQRAAEMSHAAADALGVNATDMECLSLLQNGPRTAGELARRIGLTTASMTGMIDRLEKGGFVARVRDPGDRRRVFVQLVPERAADTIAPVFVPLLRQWREAVDGYSDAELELIVGFLDRIGGALDDQVTALRGGPDKG